MAASKCGGTVQGLGNQTPEYLPIFNGRVPINQISFVEYANLNSKFSERLFTYVNQYRRSRRWLTHRAEIILLKGGLFAVTNIEISIGITGLIRYC